ncbi:hypothetical protein ACVW1C_001023 [Bradyrhizobium sp. USDA 4011]|uniref:DUF5658 domain-containing protein n=1 Tax=Bradyrhizobium erythrophlei TaxID=1437360 RepID=A0A1H5JFA8_9BRAD|nr:DUF5658 family protein [Bradyrhizobium erythrophlei]SEE51139.1 hypothetical protein SAMN05444164_8405 [Bradyrhizobium erythrophlei]
MKVWIFTDTSKAVGDPEHLKVFATNEAAQAWSEQNNHDGAAFAYEIVLGRRYLAKTFLVLSVLLLGVADLYTTNTILNLGLGELNPFMHVAQTWLGPWWLIPKLGLTYFMMWLLWRSNNPYNIAIVVAFCCTPVLNNLVIIASSH